MFVIDSLLFHVVKLGMNSSRARNCKLFRFSLVLRLSKKWGQSYNAQLTTLKEVAEKKENDYDLFSPALVHPLIWKHIKNNSCFWNVLLSFKRKIGNDDNNIGHYSTAATVTDDAPDSSVEKASVTRFEGRRVKAGKLRSRSGRECS